jgi:hypothetical protein
MVQLNLQQIAEIFTVLGLLVLLARWLLLRRR